MNKKLLLLTALLFLPPLILVLSRVFLERSYYTSSIYKIVFLFPIFYRIFLGRNFKQALCEGFSFAKFRKNFWKALGFGAVFALVYITAFSIAKGYIDLESIVLHLMEAASTNRSNIVGIGIYIIFINSLIEEFYWRGFIFKEMKSFGKTAAYIITGVGFTFHHVMFYYNWFNLPIFIIATLGLIAYSIISCYIFEKTDLFSSWTAHIFADIIQIGIAARLFGIF